MHILIIPTMYPHDYNAVSNIFFRDQAEALAHSGHKVGVIAIVAITLQQIVKKRMVRFGLKTYEENGVTTYVYSFPALPRSERLKQLIRVRIGLALFKKYTKTNGTPDIQHVHTYIAGKTAIAIEDKFNVPFVVTEHSSSFGKNELTKYQNYLAKKTFQRSRKNITVSRAYVRCLTNKYSLPFVVIPNVVNTDYFTSDNKARHNDSNISILHVANMNKRKQQPMLINAFENVLQFFPRAKLFIGGGGPEKHILLDLVQKLGINDNVVFLGKLSRAQVRTEIQRCNIFALTSKLETFGVVLIEAMACGKPVVSTKAGGPEDIIVAPEYGELVEQTVEGVTEGLIKVIRKLDTYDSALIRAFVENNYSPKSITTQLVEIYESVCCVRY